MTAKHARVGPSSLSRVSICPGSVRETADLPRRSSVFAAEGTLLHEIAADCLECGWEPRDYVGRTLAADGHVFEVTETLVDCMAIALDWLREQPGEFFVETRVSLDAYMPGQFGTSDVAWWRDDTRTVAVFDWKFGAGVPVLAKGNKQLRAYALGVVDTILKPRGIVPEWVELYIEQPRCAGGDRYYNPWRISYDDLLAFGEELKVLWARIDDPNAPLVASAEGCQFCEARNRSPQPGALSGCGTYDAFNLALIDSKFDDLDDGVAFGATPRLPRPDTLTAERRYYIVRHAKAFERWLAKLHEDSMAAASSGLPDPGSKLVLGQKGNRHWINETAAETLLVNSLNEQAYTRKVKSPAQAEKDLASRRGKTAHPGVWDELLPLIDQAEGKPILVPVEDERPALKSVEDRFDEMNETQGD